MVKRDFLSISDFSTKELAEIFALSYRLKNNFRSADNFLKGKSIGLLFQKPSTRTYVSFAVAIHQLAGYPLVLESEHLQLKRGETIADTARTLSGYLNALIFRTYDQNDLLEFARYATIPVINGLTDWEHPCQVVADLFTILEKRFPQQLKLLGGRKQAKKEIPLFRESFRIAYLGDGNNVAHSLMLGSAFLGLNIAIACPKGYEPNDLVFQKFQEIATRTRSQIEIYNDPRKAAQSADVLYVDVWTSMGKEKEAGERRLIFAPFQLNNHILRLARPDAIVMHCLPAHRGEEITDEVMDGPQSVIFEQAANRLPVQKAILIFLLQRQK